MIKRVLFPSVVIVFLLTSPAFAHFLWLAVDSKTGKNGTVNLFFEGGPGPGDGKYLAPFIERGKTWIRTLGSKTAATLKMEVVKQPGRRWLSGKLPAGKPRSLESYGKWGVYRYGETDVLLHYYAKRIEAESSSQLNELNRAEQLNLDLVPRVVGDAVELTVLWKGKPAAGRSVSIRGPGKERKNLTSGKDGTVRFQPEGKGRYTFLTKFEQTDQLGSDDGKDYTVIRHWGTLSIELPLAK